MMSFLETITFFGNDVLVPIKDIKVIWLAYEINAWKIHIEAQGDREWVEGFDNIKKAETRYKMIKHILGVKSEECIITEMKGEVLPRICEACKGRYTGLIDCSVCDGKGYK